MTAEKFDDALNTLCDEEPFKGFTVEFRDGRRLEIDFPVAFRDGKATYITAGGKPVFFDHDEVSQFAPLSASSSSM